MAQSIPPTPDQNFIDELNKREEAKKSQDNSQATLGAINKAGIKNVEATNANTKSTAEGLKNIKGNVNVINPNLAKTEDVVTAVDAIHKLNMTTFMSNKGLPELANNLENLSQKTQDLQNNLENAGLKKMSEQLVQVTQKLDMVSKTLSGTQISVDKNLQKTIDGLTRSIEGIDFKPVVNVKTPQSKVVTQNQDLSPIIDSLTKVEQAIKDNQSNNDAEDRLDLQPIIIGLQAVQDTIENQRFPVPNYVLPFKDSSGKATQVQLDSSGNIPTSGGGSGGGTVAQGTAAALSAGWPTVNGELADVTGSFTNATQTTSVTGNGLDGYANILISINGIYTTASAVFEGSDDGGTTWYAISEADRTDSNFIDSGYTGLTNINRAWQISIPGFDSIRVRSTAVASGTVNVRLSPSASPTTAGTSVSLGNPIPTGTNSIGSIYSSPDNVTTGTIVTNGDTVVAAVSPGMAGWTMGYYGTYATGATLTMEASFNGGSTYTSVRMLQGSLGTLGYVIVIAAVSNSASYFTADIPSGATNLRVRCSAWAAPTGAINIVIGQSIERFATPAIGGQAVSVTGTVSGLKTTNTAVPAATNLGVLPGLANAAAPALTETFQALLSQDLKGNLRTRISDAAGNDRGANVNATNELLIIDQGLRPAATALNTYSVRITTSTTTTPVASTAYISSIVIVTTTGVAATTLTIQDKSGTPLILVDGLATTSTLVGSPPVLNFQTPIKMTGGIDIITAGVSPASNNVWINYYA